LEGSHLRPTLAYSSQDSSPKWTGGVAQVEEHLLCKYKALNLNPTLTKKKKKPNDLNSDVQIPMQKHEKYEKMRQHYSSKTQQLHSNKC
jgi:hypothetical protein